ncbi:MAG TPA: hypothetical protein VKA13_03270 [Gammaproteobacteria bacterium]|nr:hypothetical protein [Gammaproteobacteria bacterium]
MSIYGFYRRVLVVALLAAVAPHAEASKKLQIDDTKWISIGAGIKSSFTRQESGAGNGSSSNTFAVNNARLYFNGQIAKHIKLEFNTECAFCGSASNGRFVLLDAIVKFEFSPYLNIWGGRLLVPADRVELSGPFYSNTFSYDRTPYYPSDYSTHFGTGGAGVYARDHGAVVWGAITPNKRMTYSVGVFSGMQGGPNQTGSVLVAGRFSYNFWNIEKDPGYYTSNTYYGAEGDILTLAVDGQHQRHGAGTAANPADFTGYNVDGLLEKVLPNDGVFTVQAEYKHFNTGLNKAALSDKDCFCMFDGDAYSATVLYLMPKHVGVGRFQPYVRFTKNNPSNSSSRKEYEAGINYIIDGHNAMVSLLYEYGDIATKGLNYTPSASGGKVNKVMLGAQLQI